MIKTVKKFLLEEVRLEDILNTKNDYINSFRQYNFNKSDIFMDNITIIFENIEKTFYIKYNDHDKHDLKKRINDRTNLKSIKEFNILLYKSLNELFEYHYDIIIKSYSLYIIEYNFSIILSVKFEQNEIKIGTILTGDENRITVGKKIKIHSIL